MKILTVNKFLYIRGGAETYAFRLGEYQEKLGNQVAYFGMADKKNIYGNPLNLEVSNVEFRGFRPSQITYPFRIIYSGEAKKKIGQVLDDFKPDYVHINNINYQLTPSILYAIKERGIPMVQTLHDFQNICPNHMLYIEHRKEVCEACKGRKYSNCFKNKCIHNNYFKSAIGSLEGKHYYNKKIYDLIDAFIAPSQFLADKMVEFGENGDKIHVIHNFIPDSQNQPTYEKKNYGIYFGRLSIQKGMETLISVMKELKDVNFVIVGNGELTEEFKQLQLPNVDYVGFQTGKELEKLIGEASFGILPTEWYENCPMSILEAFMLGTPMIGSRIGGVPELIEDGMDGFLFEAGNKEELKEKIQKLAFDSELASKMSARVKEKSKQFTLEKYQEKFSKVVTPLLLKENSR